ncbi:MarR family winged helix-turn-helix transcriptional regulator [Frigidibacter sp. MR17.14]|uniref:MarR family winged helix-turn-helix transcriptional regulator n=1 Tax=Frigidibacter sp. MR17.14 TaxID=3126509 RepID=UPI003012AE9C
MSDPSLNAAFFDTMIVMNRKLRTLYDAHVRTRGLTLSRARLLIMLADDGGKTQTEIAATLEIEQPSVVSLLDGVERKGLVARHQVEGDRRLKRVELTEAGRAEALILKNFARDLRETILDGIDNAQLIAATRVLDHVLGGITSELERVSGAGGQPSSRRQAAAS